MKEKEVVKKERDRKKVANINISTVKEGKQGVEEVSLCLTSPLVFIA